MNCFEACFFQLTMCFRDFSVSVAIDLLFFFNSITHLNILFSDLDVMMALVFTSLYIPFCFTCDYFKFVEVILLSRRVST